MITDRIGLHSVLLPFIMSKILVTRMSSDDVGLFYFRRLASGVKC